MTKEVLQRKAFSISRLAEFVSESELVKQIGHPVADWPLVIAKELIDNALDEAEEAGTAPSIEIMVESDSISVSDRGRGIPAETVEKLINYSTRTSSRAAYVSPTRGAQGNALQTIIAMPFALAREPFPQLERRSAIFSRCDLAGLDTVAAERADLRALVQRRKPATPDRG